jgi:REP-associated tyrosine transposase
MTKDVHLLATPAHDGSLSRLMHFFGRLYVRRFNYRYTRGGTLFQGRLKTCIVQEDRYVLTCLFYIELNPVRAGMVRDPGYYRRSSFRTRAFGVRARLWFPHDRYLDLGPNEKHRQQAWRTLIKETLDNTVMAKVRHCANTGLVSGTETFREQVHRLRN